MTLFLAQCNQQIDKRRVLDSKNEISFRDKVLSTNPDLFTILHPNSEDSIIHVKTNTTIIQKMFGKEEELQQGVACGYDFAVYPSEYFYYSKDLRYTSNIYTGNVSNSNNSQINEIEFGVKSGLQLKCGIKPGESDRNELFDLFGYSFDKGENFIKYFSNKYEIEFSFVENSNCINSIRINFNR